MSDLENVSWRATVDEAFSGLGVVGEMFDELYVDVAPERWRDAALVARERLGCTFFDFLTAVDETPGDGVRIVARVVRRPAGDSALSQVMLRCGGVTSIASIADVYAGARWHEREAAEMFGVTFTDAGQELDLPPLLLPDGFDGHPLRKDFVLAARVAKQWPGAKEPGESGRGDAPSRRRTRPPGVPVGWGDA